MHRPFSIGIAGHVDHGKTSLVRALTGIDTDRKPEEKTRGLSIEAGVAPLSLPGGREVALVDVPGHTDFLKNAIRGLSAVEGAILVVAADDGAMPQTREHLEILSFFGARSGIVVLTKADLVDGETLDMAMLELEELLADTFLKDAPILPFSVHSPAGALPIIKHLAQMIPGQQPPAHRDPFRLWVDQVRSFRGAGTVVSGTVVSGRIRMNEPVLILPGTTRSRVRSLETHGRKVEEARCGQRVGINLPGIGLTVIGRGSALVAPDSPEPSYFLNVELSVPATCLLPIKNRQKIKVHVGTAVATATVVLMDADTLSPGETGLVQLRMARKLPVRAQDPFVATLMNRHTVAGGGRVLEVPLAKFRAARAAPIIAYLEALREGDLDRFVERYFAYVPMRFLTAKGLARATGFPLSRLEAAITSRVNRGKLLYFKGKGAVIRRQFETIQDRIYTIIRTRVASDPLRKTIVLNEITTRFPEKVDGDLMRLAASQLQADQRIILTGGGYHLPDALTRFAPENNVISEKVLTFADRQGIVPFSADTIQKQLGAAGGKGEVQRLLEFMCTRDQLVQLADNRFITIAALKEIKERVRNAIQSSGSITLKDSTAILGYGRWGGAPVFDFLDSIGFTRREGNQRTLR
jgi:selenocysteine-specific elongation factor